jgi:N-formylglutamate deformylase
LAVGFANLKHQESFDTMTYTLQRGSSPLLVSMPHIGRDIPADLHAAYHPRALAVEDTDWHLEQLYNFLPSLGASVLQPQMSRYVIDLNRPPNDAPMYAGSNNTELCPTHFFTGEPLYQPGCEPDAQERTHRRSTYWQPYHTALAEELARIKQQHGYALLWDAHSIRSQVPWLFEGRLPDLNIGTASGASADASIANAVMSAVNDFAATAQVNSAAFTSVLNGRFKGGYITRHYGNPAQHVHAVQLEKCQCLYMQEEAPFAYDPAKAQQIQPLLHSMMVNAFQAIKALYAR